MPPQGVLKTRTALMELLRRGIGDTIRVSLTVPNARKPEEVLAGKQILDDVAAGRFPAAMDPGPKGLNIISCPSCSRVENEAFVELAQQVHQMTRPWADYPITIAVMGCRVNGPGETDDADLGLWCGPNFVNLKRGGHSLGAFPYTEILPRLRAELEDLVRKKRPEPPQRPGSGPTVP
jgi:(E)-4-hydroxy-3-methylbut-2-enyl-diphosphate synthase